jgi:hypothetical protein
MCDLIFAHTTVSDGQRAFCASVANWLVPRGVLCAGAAGPAAGVRLIGGAVAAGAGPGAAGVGGLGVGAAVRAGGGATGAAMG